jgi:hypothetical protein
MFQIIEDYNPNCLPIEYGGYHSLDNFYRNSDETTIDDHIHKIISMILVKNI